MLFFEVRGEITAQAKVKDLPHGMLSAADQTLRDRAEFFDRDPVTEHGYFALTADKPGGIQQFRHKFPPVDTAQLPG